MIDAITWIKCFQQIWLPFLKSIKRLKQQQVIQIWKKSDNLLRLLKRNKQQLINNNIDESIQTKITDTASQVNITAESVQFVLIYDLLLSKSEKEKVKEYEKAMEKKKVKAIWNK